MADEDIVAEAASLLLEARRDGRTIDLLTKRWPTAVDVPVAERIAASTVELSGQSIVGMKLGFTSVAIRTQMNIASPNFGWLTTDMNLTEGSSLSRLIHPRVEPEIAVVLRRPIGDTRLTAEDALSSIESVHAALEIVDTRFHDYAFTLADNTADNSSAAGFMLGAPHRPAGLIDRHLIVTLSHGGAFEARGASTDAMGGPLVAVAWLATALFERGRVLPPGSVVLTGGLTAAPYLRFGEKVSATFADLGRIDFCL